MNKTVWNDKPWWCQPWSIILTGSGIIAGSWFLFHRYWVTGLIALPVLMWMGFFLLLYPRLMAEAELVSSEPSLPMPDSVPEVKK